MGGFTVAKPGADGTAAGGAEKAALTDDQILDAQFADEPDPDADPDLDPDAEPDADPAIEPDAEPDPDADPEPDAGPAAGQPERGADGKFLTPEQKAERDKERAELAEAGKLVDAKTQKWLKDAKAPEFVKSAVYRAASYAAVGTVAEFRTYKEKLPTVQDVDRVLEESNTLAGIDELFYSDSAESHTKLLTQMHEQDPRAFKSLSAAWPDYQFTVDPDGYRADTQGRIGRYLAHVLTGAVAANDVNLTNACKHLNFKLFGNAEGKAQADPQRDAMSLRERSIVEKEQAYENKVAENFWTSCQTEIIQKEAVVVGKTLDDVLKQTNLQVKPKTREKIIADIAADIKAQVIANRNHKTKMQQLFSPKTGNRDQAHRQKIVEYCLGEHAKLIKDTTTRVINSWKDDVLATNKQLLNNKRAIADRTAGVGAGGGTGGGQRRQAAGGLPKEPGKIDYRKTSDDDLLNETFTPRK